MHGLPDGGLMADHPRQIVRRVVCMQRLLARRGGMQQQLANVPGLQVNRADRVEQGKRRIRDAVARLSRLAASIVDGSRR
jgi:hypothetical protein